METNQYEKQHRPAGSYLIAVICILLGVLFLGRNTELIPYDVFHLLVSWPMIVIVWGVFTLFRRHFTWGTLLILTGLYFLFPRLEWLSNDWLRTYWPLALVALGCILLLKKRRTYRGVEQEGGTPSFSQGRRQFISGGTQEGFVTSDIFFTSVKYIVLDPVFKGGRLDATFGGIILDLRRTTLGAPETLLMINGSFSGIELYVPGNWIVRVEVDSFLGGCNDHRYLSEQPDAEHILVIRGDVTFSGIEIKS